MSFTIRDEYGIVEKDNSVYISDPRYGVNIEITTFITPDDYSLITQLMTAEYSSIGKENYIQSSYSNTGSKITTVATYTVNGTLIEQYQYHIATGQRQYKINIEFPSSQKEYVYSDIQRFIDTFVYY